MAKRPPAEGAPALSAGSLSDDLAAQEAWLTEQARMAGHADVEALLEADYPLFEKLAAQWREEHPTEAMLSTSGGVDPYARAVQVWKAALP
jgi:hypothetical protein